MIHKISSGLADHCTSEGMVAGSIPGAWELRMYCLCSANGAAILLHGSGGLV